MSLAEVRSFFEAYRDHSFANVHWILWRGDGSLLQEFRTGYNLLRTVDGPKVLLCTAYEEDIKAMKRDAA